MHPLDIAVNCGYNVNGTSDDVSKLQLVGGKGGQHHSCLMVPLGWKSITQSRTISRAAGQETFN